MTSPNEEAPPDKKSLVIQNTVHPYSSANNSDVLKVGASSQHSKAGITESQPEQDVLASILPPEDLSNSQQSKTEHLEQAIISPDVPPEDVSSTNAEHDDIKTHSDDDNNVLSNFQPVLIDDNSVPILFRRRYPADDSGKEFSCVFCGPRFIRQNKSTYSHLNLLIRHYMKKHSDRAISEINVQCGACETYFYHQKQLERHQIVSCPETLNKDLHMGKILSVDTIMKECEHCLFIFMSESRFKKHTNSDNKGCRFLNADHPREMGRFDYVKCKFCEENFIDVEEFDVHLEPYRKNTGASYNALIKCTPIEFGTFKCRNVTKLMRSCVICKGNYASFTLFTYHMMHDHDIADLGMKCDRCDRYFPAQHALDQHELCNIYLPMCIEIEECRTIPIPKNQTSVKCPFCPRQFQTPGEDSLLMNSNPGRWKKTYARHVRSKHSGLEYPWKCKNCNQAFITQCEYDSHMTKWKCPLCESIFPKQVVLRDHLTRMHREKVRICNIDGCTRSFRQRCAQIQHQLQMHPLHKIDVYDCPCCDIIPKKLETVVKHIEMVHLAATIPRKLFSCAQCGKVYKSHVAKMRHLNVDHGNAEKVKCDICDKVFGLRETMMRHKRIHLNIKPFECEICHLSFTQKTGMRSHRNRHYNKDGGLKTPDEIQHQVEVIMQQREKQNNPKSKSSTVSQDESEDDVTGDPSGNIAPTTNRKAVKRKRSQTKSNTDNAANKVTKPSTPKSEQSYDKYPFSCEACNSKFASSIRLDRHRCISKPAPPKESDSRTSTSEYSSEEEEEDEEAVSFVDFEGGFSCLKCRRMFFITADFEEHGCLMVR